MSKCPPDGIRLRMVLMIDEIDDFQAKWLISDESHFYLSGYGNKQIQRYYNIWRSFGTIFLGRRWKNQGNTTQRWSMIPRMEELGLEDMWFQQDGATDRETMKLLSNVFPGRLISRFDGVPWPARSPGL